MILVIGDSIVDEYIDGKSTRLAPEAPVPVILNPEKTTRLGGANNVFENLLAFRPDVEFISDSTNVSTKIRIVSNGAIVARIDNETYKPYVFDYKKTDFSQYKYVVLSDYNKGALHYAAGIMSAALEAGCKVFVDPKKPLGNYKGAFCVKLNIEEFFAYTGTAWKYDPEESRKLCELYKFEHLIVTLGSNGLFHYCHRDGSYAHIYGIKYVDKVDVTGAGDVFMAALVHYYAKPGFSLENAMEYANKYAALSVSHFGTYVVTQDNIDQIESSYKTVFTNGVFDILHPGHIELLQQSAKYGRKLIVGINSDESVKRLKGNERPYNNVSVRKVMLESLACVDEVIVFDEDTPYELIKTVLPDVITKGSDYAPETVVGADLVEQVKIIPKLEGYSTTNILRKMKHANGDGQ